VSDRPTLKIVSIDGTVYEGELVAVDVEDVCDWCRLPWCHGECIDRFFAASIPEQIRALGCPLAVVDADWLPLTPPKPGAKE
jgi:PIN domain nuclease of toxin-antitoxin system